MAGVMGKRKASSTLEDASKRQRIEDFSSAEFGGQSDEDDDDYQNDDAFSNDGRAVDTPATPLSPARKKFPSELKHLKCTYEGCTKTFNRPVRLANHLKTHTNERTFLCHYEGCDKAYFEDKHLQAHIKGSHTHERKHHCEWEGCSKSFLTATRLRRHIATHEGLERFRCRDFPPCNQTFRKHQTLQRHIRSDHLELAPYPCRYINPVTNEPCNSGFDGASGLRRHEETAHGAPQFFCANCVIPNAFNPDGTPMHPGFATNSQLQSHIKKDHTNTLCIFCDKQCSNERQLQIHIEGQHSGNTLDQRRTVRCTYAGCNRSFTKKTNLDIHIRSVHLGERFVCGEFDTSETPGLELFGPEAGCGQEFTSKQYLEDHLRVAHLGQQSLLNGKRTRTVKDADEFAGFIDDAEDEAGSYQSKSRRSKRKDKFSTMQKLIGIPEPEMDIFADPDLQMAMGNPDPQLIMQPTYYEAWTPIPVLDHQETMDAPLDNIDWQLHQQALQGGPFWLGGSGHGFDASNYDIWNQEEREMSRLIGEGS